VEKVWIENIEKIKVWIIKKKLQGLSVTDICALVRISRDMFYRWWNRYQTHGWNGLQEKPKGCLVGPEIDKTLKSKVIKLRTRYEWGPKKIAGSLQHKGVDIDNSQAYKLFVKQA
jgi:transposase